MSSLQRHSIANVSALTQGLPTQHARRLRIARTVRGTAQPQLYRLRSPLHAFSTLGTARWQDCHRRRREPRQDSFDGTGDWARSEAEPQPLGGSLSYDLRHHASQNGRGIRAGSSAGWRSKDRQGLEEGSLLRLGNYRHFFGTWLLRL